MLQHGLGSGAPATVTGRPSAGSGCSASSSISPTDWQHAFLTAGQLVVFTKASSISERLGGDEWWQGGPGLHSGQGL